MLSIMGWIFFTQYKCTTTKEKVPYRNNNNNLFHVLKNVTNKSLHIWWLMKQYYLYMIIKIKLMDVSPFMWFKLFNINLKISFMEKNVFSKFMIIPNNRSFPPQSCIGVYTCGNVCMYLLLCRYMNIIIHLMEWYGVSLDHQTFETYKIFDLFLGISVSWYFNRITL